MRIIAAIIILNLFYGCHNDQRSSKDKNEIPPYRPGLGEFMNSIQLHHAKLWFAGVNNNWPLADFELHEIMEIKDDISTYCSDRPEIKALPMIVGPLDSLGIAVNRKDSILFKQAFITLTATCNTCHRSTEHAFNVVTIPTIPPVSNQDFKPLN
ncbi:MAG TPA: hypothetical protein V6C65_24740 [Allocoleopsis sp.]